MANNARYNFCFCFCQLLHPSMCEAYCRCQYALRGILVKRSTVDKSKIKEKRQVKPKDKSWVKIGWRTKNRKGWCVQQR